MFWRYQGELDQCYKINYDELIFKLGMFINIICFLRHTRLKTQKLKRKRVTKHMTKEHVFLKGDAHMNCTHILMKWFFKVIVLFSGICANSWGNVLKYYISEFEF